MVNVSAPNNARAMPTTLPYTGPASAPRNVSNTLNASSAERYSALVST